MVKRIQRCFALHILLGYTFLYASVLDEKCLQCHRRNQIPDTIVYKRYLARYSTDARMQQAIFAYLSHPQKDSSIMPPQFFLKFPMKPVQSWHPNELQEAIRLYLKHFDVKKRLRLLKDSY